MTKTHQSAVDNCECCPYGFHIHVDFAKFAEEQLSVVRNITDLTENMHGQERVKYISTNARKTSNDRMTSEKSDKFVMGNSEESYTSIGNAKLKHAKRVSPFIQQKIVDLQTSSSKTDEEIYGLDLLAAIKEFENFAAKSWGGNHSCQTHSNTTLPVPNTDNLPKCKTFVTTDSSSDPLKTTPSTEGEIASDNFVEVASGRTSLNTPLNSNDICIVPPAKCPCKSKPCLVPADDKSTSNLTLETSSKCVNTEVIQLNIATNTVAEIAVETNIASRSEQLSKLTIRTQHPITQLPDCGGEGNVPPPSTESKSEELDTLDIKEFTKVPLLAVEAFESEDIHAEKNPTDDMRTALKLVNDALLRGRTGRNVAASVSVILTEWFTIVGVKTAREKDVENYLSAFESYSSQLLRYMVNIPDMSGITALHYAVSYGNYPVVSKLLETNVADPNKANKAGYTSIMLASLAEITTQEEEQIMQKLISLGDANIKAAQHGQTALMLAASHGRFKMVKLLLEAGAEVNAQDEDGSTALMCAVEHGHADIVQCLLAHPGCDPSLTDNDGLTALNVAMEADHKDVAVLLYAHMHFGSKSALLGTPTGNSLLPKRSRSTTNTPNYQSSNRYSLGVTNDVHFVARKQHSSIN